MVEICNMYDLLTFTPCLSADRDSSDDCRPSMGVAFCQPLSANQQNFLMQFLHNFFFGSDELSLCRNSH